MVGQLRRIGGSFRKCRSLVCESWQPVKQGRMRQVIEASSRSVPGAARRWSRLTDGQEARPLFRSTKKEGRGENRIKKKQMPFPKRGVGVVGA